MHFFVSPDIYELKEHGHAVMHDSLDQMVVSLSPASVVVCYRCDL